MSTVSPVLDAFMAYLNHHYVAHRQVQERLIIQENLTLSDLSLPALPDNMTVQGTLAIMGGRIRALPENLHVTHNLTLFKTCVSTLPVSLQVDGSMTLFESRITTLPAQFRVPGFLDLTSTRVRTLPEGLDVGGKLALDDTRILRFPSDMRVGGTIHPPGGLLDIEAFMRARSNPRTEAVLSVPASQHGKMELWRQLAPFPDLMRVVVSLAPNRCLRIQRKRVVGYTIRIEMA